jgi:hypothetical protein
MMKNILKLKYFTLMTATLLTFLTAFSNLKVLAQDNCEIIKDHSQGYTTSIKSVTDNGNNSYTIELSIKHDGHTDDSKPMARFSAGGKIRDLFQCIYYPDFRKSESCFSQHPKICL